MKKKQKMKQIEISAEEKYKMQVVSPFQLYLHASR